MLRTLQVDGSRVVTRTWAQRRMLEYAGEDMSANKPPFLSDSFEETLASFRGHMLVTVLLITFQHLSSVFHV